MIRTRARRAAGAVIVLVVLAACGTGSDGDPPDTTEREVLTTEADAVTDASTDAEPTPSLPPNIWPEEIVDPTETDEQPDTDDGGVVTRAADAVGDGTLPQDVGSVAARVTSANGEVCEVCLWLADDETSRRRGLMGVTDLGDAVGMAFVWDEPRTGNFVMFQTPTPLSIAWFDETGAHVDQTDMEPCLVENSATCERYTADSPYVVAVEMFGGQLDAIGIGPGSTVELLDLDCA